MATVVNKGDPYSVVDPHIPSLKYRHSVLTDGVAEPTASVGSAKIFVDADDGDLKVIFGDGTVALIAADTL